MPDLPTGNLVRTFTAPHAVELRSYDAETGSLGTLTGHFAVFDQWTEIESWFEGRFLERLAPGAFRRTIKGRSDQIKVLYDHGYDPTFGNKPLGPIRSLKEDDEGVFYEVDLLDTSYNRDLEPGLRAGVYGASFRFSVAAEQIDHEPKKSKHNPDRIPERTITDVDLYEFGPVTFPAYEGASAGMRSGTDTFLDRLIDDPRFLARLAERTSPRVVEHILADLPAHGRSETTSDTPTAAAHGFAERAQRHQLARRTVAWAATRRSP